jgi:aminopeptidase N
MPRLGDEASPIRYDLRLRIDPRQETFSGRAEILIRVDRQISALRLNAREIAIESALLQIGSKQSKATVETLDEHTIAFLISGPIPPGVVRLIVDYEAKIDAGATSGVFKNVEVGESYVATQFERYDARRAFPSFDEPRFKTPWRVELDAPGGQRAFANAPETEQTLAADESVGPGSKIARPSRRSSAATCSGPPRGSAMPLCWRISSPSSTPRMTARTASSCSVRSGAFANRGRLSTLSS